MVFFEPEIYTDANAYTANQFISTTYIYIQLKLAVYFLNVYMNSIQFLYIKYFVFLGGNKSE